MIIDGKTYNLVKTIKDPKADIYFVDGPRGGEYIFTVLKNGYAYLHRHGKNEKVSSWRIAS